MPNNEMLIDSCHVRPDGKIYLALCYGTQNLTMPKIVYYSLQMSNEAAKVARGNAARKGEGRYRLR